MRVPSGDKARACRARVNCCPCGSVIANRVTGAAGDGSRLQSIAAAMRRADQHTGSDEHRAPPDRRRRAAASAACVTACGWPSRKSAVEMSPMRSFRSLRKQPWISARTAAGTFAGSAFQSGSLLSTVASVSDTSSPGNARLPVNIS